MVRPLLTLGLLLGALGCAPKYVKGTEITYTPEKQAVADVIERYRQAVETRDVSVLRTLASDGYYENGSTTSDPVDDYNRAGLEKVLEDVKALVKAVQYQIEITTIDVLGDQAYVDFDYQSQYLFSSGEQDKWATANDKNRIALRLEKGQWRIVSGM